MADCIDCNGTYLTSEDLLKRAIECDGNAIGFVVSDSGGGEPMPESASYRTVTDTEKVIGV
jgi:hypothetical protein